MGINIGGNPTGNFFFDVADNRLKGISHVNVLGDAPNVGLNVKTDIWDRANATDNQILWSSPTSAQTHLLKSDSSSDAPGQNGAHVVTVFGLDPNWDRQEETVSLNGATNVSTANQYARIFRMICTAFGASQINIGKITATAATDSTVTAQVNAQNGQTLMAIYSTPRRRRSYLDHYFVSVRRKASGTADVILSVKENADISGSGFVVKHVNSISLTGTSYMRNDFNPYLFIPPKSDVKIQAIGGANNMEISAGFDIIEVE
jgi:hypothetical protein